MKKFNCPVCGKELIRLEPFEKGVYEFWCDHCNIDISITKNDEMREAEEAEEFVEYARIYIHDVDVDLNELKNHLSMNGYDFGMDEKRRVLFIVFDELAYVETILTDRSIDYRVRAY